MNWILKGVVYSIQQNSVNPTRIEPGRCQIIKYFRLSVGTYTELISYKFATTLNWGCTASQRSVPYGYLHLLVQVNHGPLVFFEIILTEELDEVGDGGSCDTTTFY